MSVAAAAWRSLHPTPASHAADAVGPCASCGVHTDTGIPVASVVSAKFTNWDLLRHGGPGDPHWCPACHWSYTDPLLRTEPLLIHTDGTSTRPTPTVLRALLIAPLPLTAAVTLPVGKRKHLLPQARWGSVTSDHGPMPWTARDAFRFITVLRLRRLGFTEADLRRDAPPFDPFARLAADEQGRTLSDWQEVNTWRTAQSTFTMALAASRG